MTKRSKRKLFRAVLCMIVGILMIPMILILVGGGKSQSSVMVQSQEGEDVLGGSSEEYPRIWVEVPTDRMAQERLVAEFRSN